ncbi:MAG: hypothetical protein IT569_06295 [Leptospiraceae bacterium]|nr:hypothetical protein [Leptospiraceae bacterium]
MLKQDAVRSAQSGTLVEPPDWMGREIHTYALAISASRKVANSQYAGKIRIA